MSSYLVLNESGKGRRGETEKGRMGKEESQNNGIEESVISKIIGNVYPSV